MKKLTKQEKSQVYGGIAWLPILAGISLITLVGRSIFSDKGEAKLLDQGIKWDNTPSIDANAKMQIAQIENAPTFSLANLPTFMK